MTALPDRRELAAMVRRYRVEGYDLEDLIQEAYVCLLDPESDHDVHRHMRRLCKRSYRRKPQIARRLGGVEEEMPGNEASAASDIDAAVLYIAARSECENDRERQILKLLSEGGQYGEVCRSLRYNYGRARKWVQRLRARLRWSLYPEKGDR